MSINRSKVWLALGLQLLLTSIASSQELPDYEWVPGVRDFQPFAPASDMTSPYGSGPKRNKGWFMTIEDLAWSTSAPSRSTIGDANYTPLVSYDGQGYFQQPNSLDTSFIQPSMRQGERLQLGYVGDDGVGWLVGTFVLHGGMSGLQATDAGVSFFSPPVPGVPGNETEGFIDSYTNGSFLTNNPQIVLDTDVNHNGVFGQDGRAIFQNIGGVPTLVNFVPAPVDYGDLIQLPIIFQHVASKYSSNTWGIEVMRTWWLSKSRRADHGYWDWMAGARYIRFRDQFTFAGTGDVLSGTSTIVSGPSGATTTGPYVQTTGVLADTTFAQTAANYLVGPQIALRWTKQRGRLSWNAEGRFSPAVNFQSLRQVGTVAEQTDVNAAHYTRLPNINNFTQLTFTSGSASTTNVLSPVQADTPFLHPATVYHVTHPVKFSPIGELRLDLRYQIFRNITATVGWTGIVMGGIARSPNVVSYTLPNMGILNGGNDHAVLIQGLNFGFTVNR